ncbi:ArsC family reductase [Porticoccus sp.]|uniref:ArsC family reductase n=1 Tax=Porticoccus sp. TaxID=2024853 RepID=UPI000C5C8110|nr:ArsC family reductase [Porticoccus sp.]MAZ70940.1 ArsC family reductase [Porticoccus sp.]|tara:strand:- start:10459 stop:10812 length:354 start_codon:yes stop_codon:yes gene_type:complete
MAEPILYGIKNCDTVKKARHWLDEQQVSYRFHDVRTDGLDSQMIERWITTAGWEKVLNKVGTTWRKLDPAVKEHVSADNVVDLLMKYPTMIKRPVLDQNGTITVGFRPDQYTLLFNL